MKETSKSNVDLEVLYVNDAASVNYFTVIIKSSVAID